MIGIGTAAPHPMSVAASPEASDAYRAGLCRDCRTERYSPGRTRCETCHAAYATTPVDVEECQPWPTT